MTSRPTRPDTKGAVSGFKPMEFAAGELVFDEGEEGDACYLLLTGEVEIRKGVHGETPKSLATLRQGDIFGEMALCGGDRRMAAAIARKKSRVLAISRSAFDKQLRGIDPVMRKVIVLLTRRLRLITDEFAAYRRGEHWLEEP